MIGTFGGARPIKPIKEDSVKNDVDGEDVAGGDVVEEEAIADGGATWGTPMLVT